jgi:hypothetical protein
MKNDPKEQRQKVKVKDKACENQYGFDEVKHVIAFAGQQIRKSLFLTPA